jgi:hypothetical protein
MRIGLVFADRKCSIQKKNTLLGSWSQVSSFRDRETYIIVQFFVNILKRRGNSDSILHGKTQSVCLSCSVIGVLSQNNHLNFIKWC